MITITKEDFLRVFYSEERGTKGAGERFLGVCRYPENYWVMPDYYYPGLDSEKYNPVSKLDFSYFSSNDEVLWKCKYFKKTDNVYELIQTNLDLPELIIFGDDAIEFKKGENTIKIPFELLCGVFLKAREMEYPRPDVLDFAGPKDKTSKERWLANQEKIKELQEELPEAWK